MIHGNNFVVNNNLSVQHITISQDKAGQRIDNFLLTFLKGVPRSYVYRIVRGGEVRVNKKRVKPDYRLQAEDILRIPPVRQAIETPTVLPNAAMAKLDHAILYEDANLLVLNKPSGMAVHGGSGVSFGVIEALRQRNPKQIYELAHRLDRDTSGCLLVAKKTSVLRELHRALREHEVSKTYYALVKGHWPKRLQQIDIPLQKNQLQSGERMVRVSEEGKEALTYFQVEKCFAKASLVKARLVTGRTHQIRVHAAYAEHPIAGDDKYGDKDFNKDMRQLGLKRLFLHAYELRLCLPGETKPKIFTAPLDAALEHVLQSLN
jgi:23S rRNA pseudouridine955/2504/2580 synthase